VLRGSAERRTHRVECANLAQHERERLDIAPAEMRTDNRVTAPVYAVLSIFGINLGRPGRLAGPGRPCARFPDSEVRAAITSLAANRR
jgi:hypothetical protein